MRVTLLAGLLVSLSLDLTAPFRVNLSPKPHSSTSPSRSAIFPAVRASPLFLTPVTLPDSLADSARIAAESTLGHFERSPASSCRIDFYTNVGDETYTTLKSTDPFVKELVKVIGSSVPKVRIYFPDEGSAALCRRDWDFTDPASEVPRELPANIAVSAVPTPGFQPPDDVDQDALVIINCPKASESESVENLINLYAAMGGSCSGVVLVNPVLVDMGVTGFGLSGRMFLDRVIKPLTQTYYLKTYYNGAVTYAIGSDEAPGYTIWKEDSEAEGGYSLVDVVDEKPQDVDVMEAIEDGGFKEEVQLGFLGELADFVNGMMKL